MAYSKAALFGIELYMDSLWSKAKSHPARIIILEKLLENGTTSFSELVRIIPLARTTVSQHIRHLVRDGFILPEVRAPYTLYKLNKKMCSDLAIRLCEFEHGFI